MNRSTPIKLVSQTYTTDSIGQQVPVETVTTVHACVSSVSRAEFFAAGEKGLKPEYVLTMFAPDYNGEKIVKFTPFSTEETFAVYRTYLNKSENLELYVQKRVGK